MKLGSLFSDGVVLQQKQTIRIWGTTLPGILLEAKLANKSAYARSSAGGDFLLYLPELEAGGPFELTVSAVEYPEEAVIVKDIMVGEVWLCSGQSNMEYTLGSNWATAKPSENTVPVNKQQEKEFIETACPANDIRFITVPMQVTGCSEKYIEASWMSMTAENAPAASAAAAWFAAEIKKELNVPVGLICCSWGGSVIETWTSPNALRTNPDTRSMLETWEKFQQQKDIWTLGLKSKDELLRQIAKTDRGNEGVGKGWAEVDFDDSNWRDMEIPGSWIDQKISGNGAVWIRKSVEIPQEISGKELYLKTGGIDKHDIAYFNGVEIGRTGEGSESQYWDQQRCYKIPGNLIKAGKNTIAIRAFSFAMNGAFYPPADSYKLTGNGFDFPLAGDWKVNVEYDLGQITLPPQYSIYNHNTPGLQFMSMINPLLPFTMRGVLWYQGESNANSLSAAITYQRKLETLIKDWRLHFDQVELPFIQVQLADYRSPQSYQEFSAWAALRNAQAAVCRRLPQVFMATALDTGEENDIHPQNKKEVGRRLAANALHNVYGREVLPCGPCCIKAEAENGKLRIFFQYADGMHLRDVPEKSFYLAGADGKYYPAESAVIENETLLLSSSAVKEPVSVRYAWADNPHNILYNKKYPAAAFEAAARD